MRIYLKPVLMAAAALTLATGAAVATSNFLLTIDNPKGADAARAGKGAIEVQTFSWGASNPGAVGGAGASAGKVNMPAVSRPARTGGSGAIMLEDVMVPSGAAEAGMRKLDLAGHVPLIK